MAKATDVARFRQDGQREHRPDARQRLESDEVGVIAQPHGDRRLEVCAAIAGALVVLEQQAEGTPMLLEAAA